MVINGQSVEDSLKRCLDEAISEKQALERQSQELHHRMAELASEIDAYQKALDGYLKRTGQQRIPETDWNQIKNAKTHKDRLVLLATQNDGRIVVKDASALLFAKGIVKSKKRANVYLIIGRALEDLVEAGKFEKTNPGEYHLIGTQHRLPVVAQ